VVQGHMDAKRWNRTHVVKYLFEYVIKCSERVVSESLLKSPPRVWSEQVTNRVLAMYTFVFCDRVLIS